MIGISLVAGFRQTLNLMATVSNKCVESRQVPPFCWSQTDWEEHIQLVVSQ